MVNLLFSITIVQITYHYHLIWQCLHQQIWSPHSLVKVSDKLVDNTFILITHDVQTINCGIDVASPKIEIKVFVVKSPIILKQGELFCPLIQVKVMLSVTVTHREICIIILLIPKYYHDVQLLVLLSQVLLLVLSNYCKCTSFSSVISGKRYAI